MRKINRAYKYRILPTKRQKEIIEVYFKLTLLVRLLYRNNKESENFKELINKYSEKYSFINLVNSSALIEALYVEKAEHKERTTKGRNRMKKSFFMPCLEYKDSFKIVDENNIYISKIGNIKTIINRKIPQDAKVKKVTVSTIGDDKYYAIIMFERIINYDTNNLNKNNSIGLDYSSTHFMVDNNGKRYDMPHFYREEVDRLKRKRKELDRMVEGSNNYLKKKKEIIKIHQKIRERRRYYLHTLSTNLINKYDYIFVEDLSLEQISKRNHLKISTKDNSYGEFVKMLEYKAIDRNKKLVKIDRWYPSTKTCHVCGHVRENIGLEVKEWECEKCHTILDRDTNAAINIRNHGIKTLPMFER